MNDYDPSLVSEPPGSGGRLDFGAMLRDRIARQQKVSSNPLYRFGSALAGQDPDAGLSPLMQMLMQQEEMGLRERGLGLQERGVQVQEGQLGLQQDQQKRLGEQAASETSLRNQQAQKAFLENLTATQDILSRIEDPAERETFAKRLAPKFRMDYHTTEPDADTKGLVDDSLVTKILLTPGSQDDFGVITTILSPEQKRSLKGVKDLAQRTQIAQTFARNNALALLPGIEAKVRKVVPPGGELADPSTILDKVGLTPQEQSAFAILSAEDPKRVEQFYNKIGLLAPTQIADTQEKRSVKTPTKLEDIVGTGGLAGAIQADKEFSTEQARLSKEHGRNLEPGEVWNFMPADQRQRLTERSRGVLKQEKVDVSAAQGSAGVTAKASAEGKVPLARVIPQGIHYVDKATGEEVDYLSMSEEDMKAQGGSKRYARLVAKQFEQHTSIKETELILDEYINIAKDLTKQPGANFGQALSFWAQTKVGNPNPGVALEALKGSVLRLAGALQGSRSQLSDKDVQAIKGMLPTALDTMQTAMQRLSTVVGLMKAMRGAVLGSVSRPELDAKIQAATTVDVIGTPRRTK